MVFAFRTPAAETWPGIALLLPAISGCASWVNTKGTGMNRRIMDIALEEARLAAGRGEVPVGAVIVHGQEIVARSGNRTRELRDVTAHAEIAAIRDAAGVLGAERLTGCDLFVTLEPCAMCAAAISFARIRRLYFGAEDVKSGAVVNGPRFYSQPTCHHAPEIYSGFAEKEAQDLLTTFFKEKR
jgi:tRNA(adenine34) deaminase